jgi:serine/threonine protein kinase
MIVAPGTVLAPGYRVIQHLSRTRRLDTFEVWSEERATSAVAKTLRPDRRDDQRARDALEAEGRMLLQFTHPHIVRGYELLEDPELVLVMETLDGETLEHMIDRTPGGFEPGEVAWLALHLSSALRYLHRHGVLHLDLKPANVIADGGRAKLIDLSLARPPGRYRPGLGTWCYLSPEQAAGDRVGPAADVWGLGVVLYEAATGDPAFEDDESWTSDSGSSHTWDTSDQQDAGFPQLERPAPSATAGGRLPAELAVAIDACLEQDPFDRPPLEDIAAWLEPLATR